MNLNHVISFAIYMGLGAVAFHKLATDAPNILMDFITSAEKEIPERKEDENPKSLLFSFLIWLFWPFVLLLVIYGPSILAYLNKKQDELKAKRDQIESKMNETRFRSLYLSGKVDFQSINDQLRTYNKRKRRIPRAKFLGLSDSEYEIFQNDPSELKRILDDEIQRDKEVAV